MTFPILVQPHDGRFKASVLGSPAMAADGATKEEALAALRADINQRLAAGELVLLDVPYRAVTDFAGLFKDDPTLDPGTFSNPLTPDQLNRLRDPLNWLNGTSRWVVIGAQSGRVATIESGVVDLPLYGTLSTNTLEEKRNEQIFAAREFTREMVQMGGR